MGSATMRTVAATAERQQDLHGSARICEAFEVLVRVGGPAFSELGALRFWTEVETDSVFAADFALQVDVC